MTDVSQTGLTGGNAVAAKRVKFAHNVAGQMTSMSRYKDLPAASHVASSLFTYDSAGRLVDLENEKGTFYFFRRGRPRGRSEASSPSDLAVTFCHSESPKGVPRFKL